MQAVLPLAVGRSRTSGQAPAATRAATVPGAQQWRSPTTFVQTLVDMKNAANVIAGQFEAKGHDYRADLARFAHVVIYMDEATTYSGTEHVVTDPLGLTAGDRLAGDAFPRPWK